MRRKMEDLYIINGKDADLVILDNDNNVSGVFVGAALGKTFKNA